MVRVLLVEDDTDTANLYAFKLRRDGFSVSVARDSETADMMFRRERPVIVCLDVWLPSGAGTVLAERFAAAGAMIVLLTNDESRFEKPPDCVCRSLLKARTMPGQLSATISQLVGSTPAPA
ncbi:MAG TPA: response regulator [Candidatus Dormibacteraeota bacterium]